jgi:hypothetical protein
VEGLAEAIIKEDEEKRKEELVSAEWKWVWVWLSRHRWDGGWRSGAGRQGPERKDGG